MVLELLVVQEGFFGSVWSAWFDAWRSVVMKQPTLLFDGITWFWGMLWVRERKLSLSSDTENMFAHLKGPTWSTIAAIYTRVILAFCFKTSDFQPTSYIHLIVVLVSVRSGA